MGCYHTKDTAEFHFPSREEAKCQNNNTAAFDFMFKRTSDTNEQKQKKNNEDSFSSIQKPTLLEEIKIKGMSGSNPCYGTWWRTFYGYSGCSCKSDERLGC